MNTQSILFRWLNPSSASDLQAPCYQTVLASGMDVQACIDDEVLLAPSEIKLIGTGFAVALPVGYELQVRPRSGLAIRHGITVVNAPGTIDADYRGEVKIGLVNLGTQEFVVRRGDRIAQLVLAPVCRAALEVVDALPATVRQSGGFGHTGV